MLGNKVVEGSFMTNLLTIMQDGMDQAKVKTPRVAGRYTKLLSSLYRPMLHLAGSWIHGHRLNLYISDPDLKKDSETSIECLCLSLQSLFSELRSSLWDVSSNRIIHTERGKISSWLLS